MWNIRQVEKKHFDISLPSSLYFYFQLKPSGSLNPYSQITHYPHPSTFNWINSLWKMTHGTLHNIWSKPVNNFKFLFSSFGFCWSSSSGEESHDLVISAQNKRGERAFHFCMGRKQQKTLKGLAELNSSVRYVWPIGIRHTIAPRHESRPVGRHGEPMLATTALKTTVRKKRTVNSSKRSLRGGL